MRERQIPVPTQEERLTVLEQSFLQFRADAVKSYQDMAMQVTLFRGLTETIIGKLASIQYQIDQRFGTLEAKVDTVQTSMQYQIDQRFSTLEASVGNIQTSMQHQIDQRFSTLEAGIDTVQATLEPKIDTMQTTLTAILARLPEKA